MIKKYLEFIQYGRCLSIHTVNKYKKGLKKFGLFLADRNKDINDPENISLMDVLDFITYLRKQGLMPSSCNSVLDGVKGYLRYSKEILNLNVIDTKQIKNCKMPQRNIGYYNEEQKRQILKTVNNGIGKKEITKLRNKLLTYMFLHTGLRCHEIAKIKVEEIGETLQVIGKGGKRRVVFLRPELLEMIEEYLEKREKESDYLFASHNLDGGHIREGSIRTIYNKLTKKLGFHIHAHKFRHTFATDLLHIPGSSIYDVSRLMGHTNISTTQIYLGTNQESLKKLQFGLAF